VTARRPLLDAGKVAAARLWAANRFPYLASALFASPITGVEGLGGIAVDRRWRLYADPETVAEWSVSQLGSELVHHSGHMLRQHAERAIELPVAPEDIPFWLAAADAEINDDLLTEGLDPAHPPLLPSSFGHAPGRLAEEYFEPAKRYGKPGPCNCGSGAHGYESPWDQDGDAGDRPGDQHSDGSGLSDYQGDLVRRQVASDVLSHAKQAGHIPAGLRRWAEDIINPKVDWRRALAAELRRGIADTAGRTDYTYRRPSRRASAISDVILPALRQPVPHVAVVCDTSGSMQEDQLAQVVAEVDGILRAVGVRSEGVRVLACDADVHSAKRVRHAGQVELLGGGGTDMGRGIAAAVRSRPRPTVVVVLTDGYTPWPAQGPKGTSVVVGLIGSGYGHGPPPPEWARTVQIDDPMAPPSRGW
jgi:predicted metal-dependent peptidase